MKLPAAAVVGPMILSAAVHLAGWTAAQPPAELVAAAQVVVGAAIGCRFAGTRLELIGRTIKAAAGGTLVLMAVTLAVAFLLHAATGLPASALVLAFAPGGLAEMSLIALALSMDAAFVATHHIVRIFLVVVFAPQLFRLLGRRAASGGDD
jgi:membrane AbrB-like protein